MSRLNLYERSWYLSEHIFKCFNHIVYKSKYILQNLQCVDLKVISEVQCCFIEVTSESK